MDPDVVERLKKFKLSEREEGGVELSKQDIRTSKAQCEKSLVGKVFGGNSVNFTGIKQTMTMLWCVEGTLKVFELKNKMYQFVFSNEDERKRVLEKRPWTFDNQLLVLHPWRAGIENDAKAFLSSQMWVQAWNIPTQWFSSETVWKLGTLFNQCSHVIIPENGSKEGRYAKLLVEIDLTKPLIRGSKIRCNGEMQWVTFRYENLPCYCFYCGLIGHGERSCDKKMSDARNGLLSEGQYGEWLRALSTRVSLKGRSSGKKDLATSSIVRSKDLVVEGHGRPVGDRLDELTGKGRVQVGKVGEGDLMGVNVSVASRNEGVVDSEPNQEMMVGVEGACSSDPVECPVKEGEGEIIRKEVSRLLEGEGELLGVSKVLDHNVPVKRYNC